MVKLTVKIIGSRNVHRMLYNEAGEHVGSLVRDRPTDRWGLYLANKWIISGSYRRMVALASTTLAKATEGNN